MDEKPMSRTDLIEDILKHITWLKAQYGAETEYDIKDTILNQITNLYQLLSELV